MLVFISYATKDSKRFQINRIAEELTRYADIEEVLYWEEDLQDDIYMYMDKNIGRCDVLLAFCSQYALESEAVALEWMAALKKKKKVIPIFLKPDDIPPLLSTKRGVCFRKKNLQGTIEEIHQLILKKLDDSASVTKIDPDSILKEELPVELHALLKIKDSLNREIIDLESYRKSQGGVVSYYQQKKTQLTIDLQDIEAAIDKKKVELWSKIINALDYSEEDTHKNIFTEALEIKRDFDRENWLQKRFEKERCQYELSKALDFLTDSTLEIITVTALKIPSGKKRALWIESQIKKQQENNEEIRQEIQKKLYFLSDEVKKEIHQNALKIASVKKRNKWLRNTIITQKEAEIRRKEDEKQRELDSMHRAFLYRS